MKKFRLMKNGAAAVKKNNNDGLKNSFLTQKTDSRHWKYVDFNESYLMKGAETPLPIVNYL